MSLSCHVIVNRSHAASTSLTRDKNVINIVSVNHMVACFGVWTMDLWPISVFYALESRSQLTRLKTNNLDMSDGQDMGIWQVAIPCFSSPVMYCC